MRAVLWTLGAFCALIVIGGVVLVSYSSVGTPKIPQIPAEPTRPFEPSSERTWLGGVGAVQSRQATLPANIIFIKTPSLPASDEFELVFGEYSAFAQFCVEREAASLGVGVGIERLENSVRFTLATGDKELAQKVVLALRKYNIYAELKE